MRCVVHIVDGDYPLISVIMGVRYRNADIKLLKRAVGSIMTQTYENWELIICDDGSSLAATTYLDSLSDKRIRLVRGAARLDLASKLNACLSVANGEYIARMDDDDYSYPNRLERQLRFLNSESDAGFSGCNVSLVCSDIKVGERHFPQRPIIEDFFISQPFIHPTLLFRRKALESVGGYCEDSDCILCEDYDLLLRLYKADITGVNLQEVLFDYTVPARGVRTRKMIHRINEVKTRFKRFKELGKLPAALPYVVKPLIVGLMPTFVLENARILLEKHRNRKSDK